MTNEIVLFNDGNVNIEVQINPEQETVWLTQKQIETLFGVSHATVSEHISNILKAVSWMILLSVFPTKVLEAENPKYTTLI